jgi:hypothetical protein|tara:strand:+ start:152 stop:514 length:363 start_codon:yes stop_codon:yes gene_type:complete
LAHTVTLLADHKGFTKPKANGDEYMVDGYIYVTEATVGGEVVNASSFGLSTISHVSLGGQSTHSSLQVSVEAGGHPVNNTGEYESVSSFALNFVANDGTNAAATGNITDICVRVRVYGNL